VDCRVSRNDSVEEILGDGVPKMNEELYGVAFDYNKNYNGRYQFVKLRTTIAGDGIFMTLSCAQALAEKFRPKYPRVKVVELLRNGRDEQPAQSLAELGEIAGLDTLAEVVRKLINDGFTHQDIAAAVNHAMNG
jgi:hypothetical protein